MCRKAYLNPNNDAGIDLLFLNTVIIFLSQKDFLSLNFFTKKIYLHNFKIFNQNKQNNYLCYKKVSLAKKFHISNK